MKRVVVVDGVRIPFQLSQTVYKNELAVDLAQRALKGLLTKTALDPSMVSTYVMFERGLRQASIHNEYVDRSIMCCTAQLSRKLEPQISREKLQLTQDFLLVFRRTRCGVFLL